MQLSSRLSHLCLPCAQPEGKTCVFKQQENLQVPICRRKNAPQHQGFQKKEKKKNCANIHFKIEYNKRKAPNGRVPACHLRDLGHSRAGHSGGLLGFAKEKDVFLKDPCSQWGGPCAFFQGWNEELPSLFSCIR